MLWEQALDWQKERYKEKMKLLGVTRPSLVVTSLNVN